MPISRPAPRPRGRKGVGTSPRVPGGCLRNHVEAAGAERRAHYSSGRGAGGRLRGYRTRRKRGRRRPRLVPVGLPPMRRRQQDRDREERRARNGARRRVAEGSCAPDGVRRAAGRRFDTSSPRSRPPDATGARGHRSSAVARPQPPSARPLRALRPRLRRRRAAAGPHYAACSTIGHRGRAGAPNPDFVRTRGVRLLRALIGDGLLLSRATSGSASGGSCARVPSPARGRLWRQPTTRREGRRSGRTARSSVTGR